MKNLARLLPLALFAALASSSTSPLAATSGPPTATPPDDAAWKTAPELGLARPSKLCAAKRIGAWVRLDCLPSDWVFHVRLLAGSAEGVRLHGDRQHGAALIFPIAPGDRRYFVVNRLSDDSSYSITEETAATVTETWIDGEDAPTVTVD